MNRKIVACVTFLVLTLTLGVALVSAQDVTSFAMPGTGFTYQGQLKQGDNPVTGWCDFQFYLYDSPAGAGQIGAVVDKPDTQVTAGYFTIPSLDFGAGAFNGQARYLRIDARCPQRTGSYTTLSPRQPLTPAPYALALPGLITRQHLTSPSIIGGYYGNQLADGVSGATIAGGGTPGNTCGSGDDPCLNRITDSYGVIGGGRGNTAGDEDGSPLTDWDATVAGGNGNTASGTRSTVGGGGRNIASGSNATVAGGSRGAATAPQATVGGGYNNAAGGNSSTISGGYTNTVTSDYGAIGGGFTNYVAGFAATVPGGDFNSASGDFSFAAGHRAQAIHEGAFVWADSRDATFQSTAEDQFSARATGGARFVVGIDAAGNTTWSCVVTNGSSWSCSSDREQKENFVALDGAEVLERLRAVPILQWNAKGQDPAVTHVGPMAQDFYAAFGLGDDDKTISTIDLDGIALASIQGLYDKAQEQDAKLAALQAQNEALEARLSALERGAPARGVAGIAGPWSFALLAFGALAGVVIVRRPWQGGRR